MVIDCLMKCFHVKTKWINVSSHCILPMILCSLTQKSCCWNSSTKCSELFMFHSFLLNVGDKLWFNKFRVFWTDLSSASLFTCSCLWLSQGVGVSHSEEQSMLGLGSDPLKAVKGSAAWAVMEQIYSFRLTQVYMDRAAAAGRRRTKTSKHKL